MGFGEFGGKARPMSRLDITQESVFKIVNFMFFIHVRSNVVVLLDRVI